MSNLSTSTTMSPALARGVGPLPIAELLAEFAKAHGRTLSPRGRRTVEEVIDCLSDYLRDNGVALLAKTGRAGVVTLAGLGAWIDAFERDELVEALDGERDKLRTADTAIRALSRYLAKALG